MIVANDIIDKSCYQDSVKAVHEFWLVIFILVTILIIWDAIKINSFYKLFFFNRHETIHIPSTITSLHLVTIASDILCNDILYYNCIFFINLQISFTTLEFILCISKFKFYFN